MTNRLPMRPDSTPMSPDRALNNIASLIRDIHPSPEAEWFDKGVRSCLNGKCDLETALGLKGPGPLGNRAARRRISNRNRILRSCLGLVPGTEWQRCVAVSDRIKRLDRIRDPGEFERMLNDARVFGHLPTTPEGIWRATRPAEQFV